MHHRGCRAQGLLPVAPHYWMKLKSCNMLAAMLGLPARTQVDASGAGAPEPAGWGYPEATAADINAAVIQQAMGLAPKHVADRWVADRHVADRLCIRTGGYAASKVRSLGRASGNLVCCCCATANLAQLRTYSRCSVPLSLSGNMPAGFA